MKVFTSFYSHRRRSLQDSQTSRTRWATRCCWTPAAPPSSLLELEEMKLCLITGGLADPELTGSSVASTLFPGDAHSVLENQVPRATTGLLATRRIQALRVTMEIGTGARTRFPTRPFFLSTTVCRRRRKFSRKTKSLKVQRTF